MEFQIDQQQVVRPTSWSLADLQEPWAAVVALNSAGDRALVVAAILVVGLSLLRARSDPWDRAWRASLVAFVPAWTAAIVGRALYGWLAWAMTGGMLGRWVLSDPVLALGLAGALPVWVAITLREPAGRGRVALWVAGGLGVALASRLALERFAHGRTGALENPVVVDLTVVAAVGLTFLAARAVIPSPDHYS